MPRKTLTLAKSDGTERRFVFDHALRLLRLEVNTGKINWTIKTKGYTFIENEIIRSRKSTKESD